MHFNFFHQSYTHCSANPMKNFHFLMLSGTQSLLDSHHGTGHGHRFTEKKKRFNHVWNCCTNRSSNAATIAMIVKHVTQREPTLNIDRCVFSHPEPARQSKGHSSRCYSNAHYRPDGINGSFGLTRAHLRTVNAKLRVFKFCVLTALEASITVAQWS